MSSVLSGDRPTISNSKEQAWCKSQRLAREISEREDLAVLEHVGEEQRPLVREALRMAVLAAEKGEFDAHQARHYQHFEALSKSAAAAAAALQLVKDTFTNSEVGTSGLQQMSLAILKARLGDPRFPPQSASADPDTDLDEAIRLAIGSVDLLLGDDDLKDDQPHTPSIMDHAENDANTLDNAIEVLGSIAVGAAHWRKTFGEAHNNPGRPAKNAFLQHLAYVWRTLHRKRPSKSTDPDKNPFLRFVLAGWQDYKGEAATADDPSFAAALRNYHKPPKGDEPSS